MTRTRTNGAAAVLGAAALWGSVGPVQVYSAAPLAPEALGGWRLVVGGLVLVGLSGWSGRCGFAGLSARTVWPWVVAAAIATAVYQAAFLASVDRVGAAVATAVTLGVTPVFTGLCARWWLGEALTRMWVLATVMAVVGLVLLLDPSSRGDLAGFGLGVLGGACYGIYTVTAKRLAGEPVRLTAVTAVSVLVGGLLLAPWMVRDSAALIDVRSVVLVLWFGIGATAAAYWLFARGLARISAGTAGTLSLAEPLVAVAAGVLLLGETLTSAAVAGCLLLLTGLVLVSLDVSPRQPSSSRNWSLVFRGASDRDRTLIVTADDPPKVSTPMGDSAASVATRL